MKRLIISLFALAMAGCSTVPQTDSAKVADAIGTIQPSRKDTCETLRQIAQQTSRIETIKQGKEVVYASPKCEPAKG